MPHIVSTLSADTKYTEYNTPSQGGGANTPVQSVLVKGGHGVAHSNNINGVITPNGVVTDVTDDQLAFLNGNVHFQNHVKNGFLTVVNSKPADTKKIVRDMEKADASAPIKPDDFEKGGKLANAEAKPTVIEKIAPVAPAKK